MRTAILRHVTTTQRATYDHQRRHGRLEYHRRGRTETRLHYARQYHRALTPTFSRGWYLLPTAARAHYHPSGTIRGAHRAVTSSPLTAVESVFSRNGITTMPPARRTVTNDDTDVTLSVSRFVEDGAATVHVYGNGNTPALTLLSGRQHFG
jgi:hypothetical protein